ncbi:MAG: hypothetical protein GC185_11610 [Alphaproteobacteria bacterium]|nr:hypothetical protein [Alphaproteobacteria bacterium]
MTARAAAAPPQQQPAAGGMAQRLLLPAFGFSLFLSALVMFALEPMTGKMLLPLVGGTPAGWIVAMAFFQIMLLLGYLLAHLLARFSPRRQALLYIGVLGLGLFFLPPHLPAASGDGTPGAFGVFALLCRSLALPFIALSAGSSTLQRLFTTARHRGADDPYFLYAASNLGSFAGLLLYPLAFEPAMGLLHQGRDWSLGYGALILAVALCLTLCAAAPAALEIKAEETQTPAAKIPWRRKLHWLLLAFVPSSLMLGVTTEISADIFSAPMLWVLPLSLYLLTFVAAFSRRRFAAARLVEAYPQVFVTIAVAVLVLNFAGPLMSLGMMAVHLLCFTCVALGCHMRLAALRPADGKSHLTDFYLMLALGGALGGMLNAFVVPLVLDRPLEYPAMLILSLALRPDFFKKSDRRGKFIFAGAMGCALLFSLLAGDILPLPGTAAAGVAMTLLLLAYIALTAASPRAAFFGAILLLLVVEFAAPKGIVSMERNFYGVLKVFEHDYDIDGKTRTVRYMSHGTTIHGVEIMDPAYARKPLGYYGAGSGIERLFTLYRPKDTIVMGLGTGQLNCYNPPGGAMTMVDIDPAVIKMARSEFGYLSACKGRKPVEVIQGDARLELNRLKNRKFDLIVLDAFSGDSIPVHLLTMEALAEDMAHLKKGGIIAANISNRYFTLAPVLAATARLVGLQTRFTVHLTEDMRYNFPSLWIAMAPEGADLTRLDNDDAATWVDLPPTPGQRVWTDDYSSMLDALNVTIPFLHKQKTLAPTPLP